MNKDILWIIILIIMIALYFLVRCIKYKLVEFSFFLIGFVLFLYNNYLAIPISKSYGNGGFIYDPSTETMHIEETERAYFQLKLGIILMIVGVIMTVVKYVRRHLKKNK